MFSRERIKLSDTVILIGDMVSIEEINVLIRIAELSKKNDVFIIGLVSLPADQHKNCRSEESQVLSKLDQFLDSVILVPDIGHYQSGTTIVQQVAKNLVLWYLASRHRYFCPFDLNDVKGVLTGRASYFNYEIPENTNLIKDTGDRIVPDLSDFKGGLIHFQYNNFHNTRKKSTEQIFRQIERVVEIIDDNGNWIFDRGDWLFTFTEDRDCQKPCSISVIPVG